MGLDILDTLDLANDRVESSNIHQELLFLPRLGS